MIWHLLVAWVVGSVAAAALWGALGYRAKRRRR